METSRSLQEVLARYVEMQLDMDRLAGPRIVTQPPRNRLTTVREPRHA